MCVNEGANIEMCTRKSDIDRIGTVKLLNPERSRYLSAGNDAGMLDRMSFRVMPGPPLNVLLRVRDVRTGRFKWLGGIKAIGRIGGVK
jgi:hypothetical protein